MATIAAQSPDRLGTGELRYLSFLANNQFYVVENLSGSALSFDIKRGIASINTPVPGCPGGAVVNISATTDTIDTKTKTMVKGSFDGKQKSDIEIKTREAYQVTGTLCGNAIESVSFGQLLDSSSRKE